MKQQISKIILISLILLQVTTAFQNPYEYLENEQTYQDLLELTQLYYKNQTFPGSQISVFTKQETLHDQISGKLTYERQPFDNDVDELTMYDMASLTKVVSTTSALMILYDRGLVKLNDKLVKFVPEADNHGKGEIEIQNLLLHNAGLPPDYEPYDELETISKQQFLDWVYNCELVYPIGTESRYSDISMVFAQQVIENITGQSLSTFVDENVFRKLGMTRTLYQPSVAYQSAGYCAPTTYDLTWRMQLLRCVVHDPTAYVMGGVCGNAGLFSYYKDVTIFMKMMLNYGTYNNVKIFEAATVNLFTTRVTDLPYHNTRALGWDTCSQNAPCSCGKYFGANSFGHTGYTGTSLWGDKETGLGVTILTNRVYPDDASSSGISWFRYNAMNLICEINGY